MGQVTVIFVIFSYFIWAFIRLENGFGQGGSGSLEPLLVIFIAPQIA